MFLKFLYWLICMFFLFFYISVRYILLYLLKIVYKFKYVFIVNKFWGRNFWYKFMYIYNFSRNKWDI